VTYQKRNKVPTLGFRAKAANTIIPITHCAILSPKIGARLICLADTLGQLNTKVSQVKVSIGDTQNAVLLEPVGNITEKERNFLANDMKENDFSWYLRQEKASYPLNSLIPKLSYTIPSDKIKIDFNPEDFTQINPEVNYQLIKLVVELLGLSVQETVIDLYCGLGNFTLPVAKHAGHVTGIEGSANMTRRAQENAASNNISNTSFYTSDLTSSKTWENSQWAKKRYTKLLMDPPRTGALAVLPWIGQMRPQCIVYLSCHPVTFARDLGVLVHKYRYKLTKIGVIDMFPHTAHIESIAVLEL
jgi:23S rRNA (uracil1939-C5)-methyltransferase